MKILKANLTTVLEHPGKFFKLDPNGYAAPVDDDPTPEMTAQRQQARELAASTGGLFEHLMATANGGCAHAACTRPLLSFRLFLRGPECNWCFTVYRQRARACGACHPQDARCAGRRGHRGHMPQRRPAQPPRPATAAPQPAPAAGRPTRRRRASSSSCASGARSTATAAPSTSCTAARSGAASRRGSTTWTTPAARSTAARPCRPPSTTCRCAAAARSPGRAALPQLTTCA